MWTFSEANMRIAELSSRSFTIFVTNSYSHNIHFSCYVKLIISLWIQERIFHFKMNAPLKLERATAFNADDTRVATWFSNMTTVMTSSQHCRQSLSSVKWLKSLTLTKKQKSLLTSASASGSHQRSFLWSGRWLAFSSTEVDTSFSSW